MPRRARLDTRPVCPDLAGPRPSASPELAMAGRPLWDIASRAHILLRSSEFGLSGFMRRFLTGYAIRYNHRHRRWGHLFQNRYKSIVCDEREKVSIEELTSGSRQKEVSAIRGRIVPPGVEKYGIALAEVARRVGVSTSAISKIMQRANK